jgi:hypothetical protein
MTSISPVCKKCKTFILALKSPTYRDFMIKKSFKSKTSKSHTWAPLKKNQVPRELTLIAIFLACLVAQWNSYGGSWKWVTILPIVVRLSSCCLPFVSLFFICASTTAFTWLSKVWTLQLSSAFYLSWDLSWCRVLFWKGDLQFSNCLRIQFVKVFAQ